MSRPNRLILLLGGLGLAACSERVIVRAAPDVLVTMEDIKPGDPLAAAQVHYLFAKPALLAEGDEARVVRMRYDAVFDCTARTWGHRSQELTLADGRSMSQAFAQPAMEAPRSGTLGEGVIRGVCDPTFRKDNASRRPLVSIEKDYLEAMGQAATGR